MCLRYNKNSKGIRETFKRPMIQNRIAIIYDITKEGYQVVCKIYGANNPPNRMYELHSNSEVKISILQFQMI